LIGKKLDSGNKVKKNQKIEKEINLYLRKRRFAEKIIVIKNKKLIKKQRKLDKVTAKTFLYHKQPDNKYS